MAAAALVGERKPVSVAFPLPHPFLRRVVHHRFCPAPFRIGRDRHRGRRRLPRQREHDLALERAVRLPIEREPPTRSSFAYRTNAPASEKPAKVAGCADTRQQSTIAIAIQRNIQSSLSRYAGVSCPSILRRPLRRPRAFTPTRI